MIRIQRQRTKGWKSPEGCVYVGRPTVYGNPFRLTVDGWVECYSINRKILDPWILWSATGGFTIKDLLELYRMWIQGELGQYNFLPISPDISKLKDKDLSCWCPLDQPCHVDVIIELLNQKS